MDDHKTTDLRKVLDRFGTTGSASEPQLASFGQVPDQRTTVLAIDDDRRQVAAEKQEGRRIVAQKKTILVKDNASAPRIVHTEPSSKQVKRNVLSSIGPLMHKSEEQDVEKPRKRIKIVRTTNLEQGKPSKYAVFFTVSYKYKYLTCNKQKFSKTL